MDGELSQPPLLPLSISLQFVMVTPLDARPGHGFHGVAEENAAIELCLCYGTKLNVKRFAAWCSASSERLLSNHCPGTCISSQQNVRHSSLSSLAVSLAWQSCSRAGLLGATASRAMYWDAVTQAAQIEAHLKSQRVCFGLLGSRV